MRVIGNYIKLAWSNMFSILWKDFYPTLKYCLIHSAGWKVEFFSSYTDVLSVARTHIHIHKDVAAITGVGVWIFVWGFFFFLLLKDVRSSSLLFTQSLPTKHWTSIVLYTSVNPIYNPKSNGYFILAVLYQDTIMKGDNESSSLIFLTMVFFSCLFLP